jgi:ABC-type Co2+ transport system permease subunit
MKASWFHFSLLKQPSAWIPLGMSLAALALVVGHALVHGVVHEADEGAAAHTWQILMAGQLPFVAYFIVRWLPKQTREALQVLAILALTWLANFAAVFRLT